MKLNSIQIKVALIIVFGFVLTTFLVVFLVDQKMTSIINSSQESEYSEKLQTIFRIIQGNERRLQQTEMVVAYLDDFQGATLRQLKTTYSQMEGRRISPFVISGSGQVLLSPNWPTVGNSSYIGDFVQHIRSAGGRSFVFSLPGNGDVWCVFRSFDSWDWLVGYMVPLDVKYRIAHELKETLLAVIGFTALLVASLMAWLIRSQLRPITALTAASAEMAQGNLDSAIEAKRNDEVGLLTNNFNQMQISIQRTIASLKESENRLSLALIGSNSGLWDWDLLSDAIYFDDHFFRLAGYEPGDFPHAYDEWKKRVHPEDVKRAEDAIQDHLSGQKESLIAEYRFKTKQGLWIWILGQGVISERNTAGEPIRLTGTQTDISERKTAEEALRSSEEDLRTTLDSIGDAVIATDTGTHISRMNPVAERLTGWAAGDAVGRPLEDVFRVVHGETRQPIENPAMHVLKSGEVIGLADDAVLIAPNGSEYNIADSGAPIRNGEGKTVGVVLVFRDVTEEKALLEQIQQSQKMDTIGQLAGGVAHDFNNMLGGIIGATDLLDRILPEDPRARKFLSIIMESAERAADLTTKLLAFSRKQHISSTPIDVHSALSNAISLLESTVDRRISIKTDLAAESSMVVGDLAQLQNVFLNIFINGAQAMPEGGVLSISTQVLELEKAFCEASIFDLQPGLFLEIEIRDNGCGMPPENLEKIFEPFFTTKGQGKGTGLGLAAVFGTVQLHHGAITVYSEEGTGSVFSVLLPVTEAGPVRLEVVGKSERGTGLILVVDDEAVMRATAAAILEDLGYEVLLAENGRIGLEVFSAKSKEIDLVLLDMIMPEMNGRDCFTAIRKIDPTARVVLSSGFTRGDDLADLRAEGLLGFIRKPYRGVLLSRAIAAALSEGKKESILWTG